MHQASVVAAIAATVLTGAVFLDDSTRATGLDAVAFMEGCWRGDQGPGAYMEERYGPALENLMLGTTVYVRDGRAVQHELTEIVLLGDGRVRLTPYPGGTESADPFFLTGGDGEAIFEAPAHDPCCSDRRDSFVHRVVRSSGAGREESEWASGAKCDRA